MNEDTVLVTGGTGFLGAHCIVGLLAAGYRVRTTMRDLGDRSRLDEMLRAGGVGADSHVGVVETDLTRDDGWADAVAGCAYVLHVASPYPSARPRDESELLIPARDGSLRVLRAARDAGVRRVVLTSSFAAIGYGHATIDHPLTEQDWTDPTQPGVEPYQRSKTIAERAAWEFIDSEGHGLELSVVNPVGIVGPLLSDRLSTSVLLLAQLLNRQLPALPRTSFGLVDVRDVVDLHLRAMTAPEAHGQRFLASAGDALWVSDIARILHDDLGTAGSRVPLRTMPDVLVRAVAFLNPSIRPTVHELGIYKPLSSQKAREVLGWRPRTAQEALVATGESLQRHGLITHLRTGHGR